MFVQRREVREKKSREENIMKHAKIVDDLRRDGITDLNMLRWDCKKVLKANKVFERVGIVHQ